jgi:hypothetical protein
VVKNIFNLRTVNTESLTLLAVTLTSNKPTVKSSGELGCGRGYISHGEIIYLEFYQSLGLAYARFRLTQSAGNHP